MLFSWERSNNVNLDCNEQWIKDYEAKKKYIEQEEKLKYQENEL